MPGSKLFCVKNKQATEVYRPNSLENLVEIVKNKDNLTLLPVGGGTQLELGDRPEGKFAALYLEKAFPKKIDHEPADLTVLVSSNTTLKELQDKLKKAGQRVPIDPPNNENATIGGILAVGIGGPLQSRFGPPRDWVLGMAVLRADGEIVRAGGRVVKNVTGYDLMRLWCGSLGTIGIITEVALRVTPIVTTNDYSAAVTNFPEAKKIVDEIFIKDIRPECADILIKNGTHTLFLRLSEQTQEITQTILPQKLIKEEKEDLYLQARDLGFTAKDELTIRVSCTNSTLEFIVNELQQLHPDSLLVRPLTGLIRATWESNNAKKAEAAIGIASLREKNEVSDAIIIIERSLDQNIKINTWGLKNTSFALMKKIKDVYDPNGRFNKGRYLGGI